MNQNPERMVTGLFAVRASAEQACQSASSRGYGKDDINLIMSDETRKRDEDAAYLQGEWATSGQHVYRGAAQSQRS